MKSYNLYKDSKLPWAGKIPDDWALLKIGRSFNNISSGTTPKSTNRNYYEGGNINWLNTGDLNDSYILITKKRITPKAIEENSTLKVYPIDSVVIALYGATIGKLGQLKIETTTNQACCVLSNSEKITQRFLFYYFSASKEFIISKSYGGGQPNISQELIKQLYVPTPSIIEQAQIAKYLDYKTGLIDAIIEKKELLIKKLKKQRQAIINEAVTKGLNPNTPMKDSGIEWLGEIPEHWEVLKLKYLATITRGAILRPVDDPNYFDEQGEWTYLNISDATKCDKYLNSGKLRLSQLGSTKSARVEPNNLIMTASATIGKMFINQIPVCVHDGFIPITELKCSIDFLYHYLGNPQLYVAIGKSNTQKNIYLDEVKNMIISLPPKDEQVKIFKFLEENNLIYTDLRDKVLSQIQKLKSYRQSIISEAVTGKVDVRDWVQPEKN